MSKKSPLSISWRSFTNAVRALEWELREANCVPTAILGIARGGLTPAVMLSHAFGARMEVFDERLHNSETLTDSSKLLVVDDIYDSGATYRKVHACLPNATYAVVFSKVLQPPGFHGRAVSSRYWVVFPWEQEGA